MIFQLLSSLQKSCSFYNDFQNHMTNTDYKWISEFWNVQGSPVVVVRQCSLLSKSTGMVPELDFEGHLIPINVLFM